MVRQGPQHPIVHPTLAAGDRLSHLPGSETPRGHHILKCLPGQKRLPARQSRQGWSQKYVKSRHLNALDNYPIIIYGHAHHTQSAWTELQI